MSIEKKEKPEENSLKTTVRRGLFYAALGLIAFGIAGGAVSLLLGFTKFENLKAAATVCFLLPIPLFLFLLLFEKNRKKKGKGKRFRTLLPLYAAPLVLYGVLFAVSFRVLPAGLFRFAVVGEPCGGVFFRLASAAPAVFYRISASFGLVSKGKRGRAAGTGRKILKLPKGAEFCLCLPIFCCCFIREDRSLREALAVLTKERGWTLCAPEERCSREPSCILTDLDGKTGSYSGNDFGDLPKYTVSFLRKSTLRSCVPSARTLCGRFSVRSERRGRGRKPAGKKTREIPAREAPRAFPTTLFFDGTSLFLAGTRISLSKKERQIFALLYEADGQPLRVEEIADAVWGRSEAVNNVRVYIRYLRRKIAAVSDRNYIKTVREGGFYLRRDRDE